MFKKIIMVAFIAALSACQSVPVEEQKMPTAAAVAKAAKASQGKAEQEKAPNPIKCQQAKLNLVEAEGTQDVGQINFAKDAVHRFCDDFQ